MAGGAARGDWFIVDAGTLSAPSPSAALTSLQIQEAVLHTALEPGNFAQAAANAIHRLLNLSACSIFIRTRGLEAFELRASAGFDYSSYDTFLIKNPSYASLACEAHSANILVALAPLQRELFANQALLKERDIDALVVVPFTPPARSDTDYPNPLGALYLYAPSGADLDDIVSISATLQPLIGALYVASLERLCMQLRAEAVESAAFAPTLSDAANAILKLACSRLNFSAGSLWLLNPRRQVLQLRAVEPALRKEVAPFANNIVRLETPEGPSENPIALCFATRHKTHNLQSGTIPGGSRFFANYDPKKLVEDYGETLHNIVAIPLKLPFAVTLGSQRREALGVMTLTNHFLTLGTSQRYYPTTWEDLKLSAFVAEVASVMVYQGLLAQDHEADYERRIHGLKANLVSARDTLQQLVERADLDRHLDTRLRHHIPNTIEWILEMEQQVGRSDKIERLQVSTEAISLTKPLAQAVRAGRTSVSAHRIDGFEIVADSVLKPGSPTYSILADNRAFQTIMRNLFENSMKYRNKEHAHSIVELWVETPDDDTIELHYSDNGIGIPREDIPFVFLGGFRGKVARRVNVQGQGIGLRECQLLMQQMRGNIRVERRQTVGGVEFILTFRRARDEGR